MSKRYPFIENYREIINELMDQLILLNIPISQKVHFKECSGITKCGYCTKKGACKIDGYDFEIALNRNLICENDIKATIVHELLHTIPRCYSHGKTWQKYAAICSKALGLDIKIVVDYKLKPSAVSRKNNICPIEYYNPEFMNMAECPSCHNRVGINKRIRPNKFGYYNYVCRKCKKRIVIIK